MVTPTTGSPASSVDSTGDYRIDALLKGTKWGGPAGTGFDVTYSFPQIGSSIFSTSTFGGYGSTSESGEPWDPDVRSLNAHQQQYFSEAMDQWSEVANIAAGRVADNASVVGDIRATFSGRVDDEGAAAWAYYPNSSAVAGDVWLNSFISDFDNSAPGGSGFHTFLHEIGHALGLSHSFGGGLGVLGGSEDTHKFTVMSYTKNGGVGGYAHTPMLYDILAIQHLYGANTSTRDGDTTYAFSAAGESFMTIWDGGGDDTIDASAQSLPVDISLVAGTYSSIGPRTYGGSAFENVAIAFNVTIENATGGDGPDTIDGNAANNVLRGLDGNDTLAGGAGGDSLAGDAGDDSLDGEAGGDTMSGGTGEDSFDGGSGSDTADYTYSSSDRLRIDLSNGTAWFVDDPSRPAGSGNQPSTTETLTSIENGIGSTGDTVIIGNVNANILDGAGGSDDLQGGGGDDTLMGGSGEDSFDGDSGSDTVDYTYSSSDRLRVDLSKETAWFVGDPSKPAGSGNQPSTTEELTSIENVIGTRGDNVIIGDSGSNIIDGSRGVDTITGGGGNDLFVLRAGDGADIILDYNDSHDGFLLDGLSYSSLDFVDTGPDTEIQIDSTNQVLAILKGVDELGPRFQRFRSTLT